MSFKIFTKVVANRIAIVAQKVIQMTLMSGRNIMEAVVILHEISNEMHRKKLNGVLLTIF